MAWYQRRWWYIERPFPWPLWLLIGVVAAGLIAALVIAC